MEAQNARAVEFCAQFFDSRSRFSAPDGSEGFPMQAITMERSRFYLEGVEKAIVANVAHRGASGLVIEQPLPFLRLDTTVRDESGIYRRVSRVDIALEDGVPRLVLELAQEPEEPSAPAVVVCTETRDQTDRIFTPGVSSRPARTDSTVPYDYQTTPKREPAPAPMIVAPRLPTARPSIFARFVAWVGGLFRTPATV
jgi:hypothetical protein